MSYSAVPSASKNLPARRAPRALGSYGVPASLTNRYSGASRPAAGLGELGGLFSFIGRAVGGVAKGIAKGVKAVARPVGKVASFAGRNIGKGAVGLAKGVAKLEHVAAPLALGFDPFAKSPTALPGTTPSYDPNYPVFGRKGKYSPRAGVLQLPAITGASGGGPTEAFPPPSSDPFPFPPFGGGGGGFTGGGGGGSAPIMTTPQGGEVYDGAPPAPTGLAALGGNLPLLLAAGAAIFLLGRRR